jgi:hypothetical protein
MSLRDLADSGVVRRLYFSAPSPRELAPAAVRWWPSALPQLRSRLTRECCGDLRRLQRWSVAGWDLDFSGSQSGRADVDGNPFVLVPRMLGGLAPELMPLQTAEDREGAARALAQHDTSATVDVLFENWSSVLAVSHRERTTCADVDAMASFADAMSDLDVLGRWREGDCGGGSGTSGVDADPSEREEVTAVAIVLACGQHHWAPFKVGARRSRRMECVVATEANRALMEQQRLEQVEQTMLLFAPTSNGHSISAWERLEDLAFERACSNVKGKRALTASQALDWPVCLERE